MPACLFGSTTLFGGGGLLTMIDCLLAHTQDARYTPAAMRWRAVAGVGRWLFVGGHVQAKVVGCGGGGGGGVDWL